MEQHDPKVKERHHHILPDKTALMVGGALLFLTVTTVYVAGIDLGALNFPVAMLVATVKALLVALFFMNLLWERRENGVIFGTSFLFLAIFIVLTGTDMFFRGDVAVKGPFFKQPTGISQISKPWVASSQLIARGQELFKQQCVACHGEKGQGNGPAAGALAPPPRNFTSTEGWKNGRKATEIFKTLKEGIPGTSMASYASLPSDDRWALVHYVASLGPAPVPADTPADFAKIGVDPTKEGSAEAAPPPTISMELAMEKIQQPDITFGTPAAGVARNAIFSERCSSCHGATGEGARVSRMGQVPEAYVVTRPFTADMPSLQSAEAFNRVVQVGLPGTMMPGSGDLSAAELSELYQYVKSASAGAR